jgi:uncharacterized protein
MDSRAAELIASLRLAPHPEGGYFREIHRSSTLVTPSDGRGERSALTTIYFLLTGEDVSRWHRVASDEVWHHYEGARLELFTADPAFDTIAPHVLGPTGDRSQPVHTVAADDWQAARSTGGFTLVGCTVGPGFEFADFRMLRDRPADVAAAVRRHPAASRFV